MKEYNMIEKVADLGKTVARTTANTIRKKKIDDETKMKRMEICRSCDKYHKKRDKCKICGCRMKYKIRLSGGECPLGKW